jgi:cathepsin A (carboxypeptidase C)
MWGFYDTLCTTKPGVSKPVFNATSCKKVAESLPRCDYIVQACTAFPDPAICNTAYEWCYKNVLSLYYDDIKAGGRNPYDITAPCDVDGICYQTSSWVEDWVNSKEIRAALNIPKQVGNCQSLPTAMPPTFWQSK